MVVGDGSCGLDERAVDGGCFTVGDVVWGFLLETRAELSDKVLLFHLRLDVEGLLVCNLLYKDFIWDLIIGLMRNRFRWLLIID